MSFPPVGAIHDLEGRILGLCCLAAPGLAAAPRHVIGDLEAVLVSTGLNPRRREMQRAAISASDEMRDLALLSVDRDAWRIAPAKFAPADEVEVGEQVLILTRKVRDSDGESLGMEMVIPAIWEGQDAVTAGVRYGLASLTGIDPPSVVLSGCPVVRVSDHAVLGLVSRGNVSRPAAKSAVVTVIRSEDVERLTGVRDSIQTGARQKGERLIGRQVELERLIAALRPGSDFSCIFVSGDNGIGKTALVRSAVNELRLQSRPPVVVWFSGPVSPDAIFLEIASRLRESLADTDALEVVLPTLDLCRRREIPWARRLEALRRAVLRQFPLVVTFDDLQSDLAGNTSRAGGSSIGNVDVQSLLRAWLEDPGLSKMVLVSRLPPALEGSFSAERIHIGPLTESQLRQILVGLPESSRLEPQEEQHLVAAAEGSPRALMRFLSLWRSGGQDPQLSEPGAGGSITDKETLAASLESVWANLSEPERSLLVGLSVFRESVEMSAAYFVFSEDSPTRDEEALRRSIARVAGALFESGAIDSIENGIDVARRSLAVDDALDGVLTAIFEQLAPPIVPDPRVIPALGRLAARSLLQWDQLEDNSGPRMISVHRTVADSVCEWAPPGQTVHAHRRAAAFWQWRHAVRPQSQSDDVRDVLEARFHAIAASDDGVSARLSSEAASLLHALGEYDRETRLLFEELDRLPHSSLSGDWLRRLGVVAQMRGDYSEAADLLHRSLEISQRLGDQGGLATTYQQLGVVAQARGDYSEAADLLHRSLEISQRLGDQVHVARTLITLAGLAHATDADDLAVAQLGAALILLLRLENPLARQVIADLSQLLDSEEEPQRTAALRNALGADADTVIELVRRSVRHV